MLLLWLRIARYEAVIELHLGVSLSHFSQVHYCIRQRIAVMHPSRSAQFGGHGRALSPAPRSSGGWPSVCPGLRSPPAPRAPARLQRRARSRGSGRNLRHGPSRAVRRCRRSQRPPRSSARVNIALRLLVEVVECPASDRHRPPRAPAGSHVIARPAPAPGRIPLGAQVEHQTGPGGQQLADRGAQRFFSVGHPLADRRESNDSRYAGIRSSGRDRPQERRVHREVACANVRAASERAPASSASKSDTGVALQRRHGRGRRRSGDCGRPRPPACGPSLSARMLVSRSRDSWRQRRARRAARGTAGEPQTRRGRAAPPLRRPVSSRRAGGGSAR